MSIDTQHLSRITAARPRSSAALEPSTWDAEARTIDVVWYTGEAVTRYSWEDGDFVLEFDMGGADLARYNGGASVLIDHLDHTVQAQIGKIVEGSAKVENGHGVATLKLSGAPEHAGLVGNIAEGIVKHLSMGTEIDEASLVYLSRRGVAGATETRILAKRWAPYELSFVAVPAAAGSQTLAHSAGDTMPAAPAQSPDTSEITFAAQRAERLRAAGIREAGRLLRPLGEAGEKLVADLLDSDVTLDAARGQIIKARADWDDGQKVATARPSTVITAGADNSGKLGKALARAIAVKMGANAERIGLTEADHALVRSEFGHALDPVRIAERNLAASGVRFQRLSPEAILARAALNVDRSAAMLRYQDTAYGHGLRERLGEISVDDLDLLLSSATELTVLDAYMGTETTYQAWCKIMPMADFRDTKMVDFSRMPDLEEIPESGIPLDGSIAEAGETLSLKEYGRSIRFSRRSLINDKYNVIGLTATSIGRRVATKRNALAYAKLVANPTLSQDSTAVFHADHGNVGTTAALSATTLAELRKKIREQTGVEDAEGGSMRLNLPMRSLVVGSALELAAEQLLSGSFVPTAATGVMPASLRSLTTVADAEISSTTAFYGFADPSIAPCFVETVLGDEGIIVDQMVDDDTKGVKLAVRVAHNVQAVSFRGGAYNAGE